MRRYEKIMIATMDLVLPHHADADCRELEEVPYNFYQGQVVFEDDENLEKIAELGIKANDKVKIGVYKSDAYPDEEDLYWVDIIEKEDK